jgi:hypothetical protein
VKTIVSVAPEPLPESVVEAFLWNKKQRQRNEYLNDIMYVEEDWRNRKEREKCVK